MSLHIKTISSLNLKGTPIVDNIFYNIKKFKGYLSDQFNNNLNNPIFTGSEAIGNSNELIIVCIQGLYDYRTGLIGKIFTSMASYFSTMNNPIYLQSIVKLFASTESNDYELIAFVISILSRIIPINNICTYNVKENSHILSNDLSISQPSFYNLKSLFLLSPLFDSGCAIYSNKEYTECGFEKWNYVHNQEIIKNKGMTWCYYESESKTNGITVINLDFNNNNDDLSDIENLKQLVQLKTELELKYISKDLKNYETYIVGNFYILFNMSNIISEINEKLLILKNANIQILSDIEDAVCQNYILYSKFEFENEDAIYTNFISYKENIEDIGVIYKIDYIDELQNIETKDNTVVIAENETKDNTVVITENETKHDEVGIAESKININLDEKYFDRKNGGSPNSEGWETII